MEITLIENFPCYSLDELRARERYWIERLDCVNKVTPCVTREEALAKKRQWRDDHSDTISVYRRERLECELCGLLFELLLLAQVAVVGGGLGGLGVAAALQPREELHAAHRHLRHLWLRCYRLSVQLLPSLLLLSRLFNWRNSQ